MFCLPWGVKHSRYKNMILKLTPLFTTLTIIKDYPINVNYNLLHEIKHADEPFTYNVFENKTCMFLDIPPVPNQIIVKANFKYFHNVGISLDFNVFSCLQEIYYATAGRHILTLLMSLESLMI